MLSIHNRRSCARAGPHGARRPSWEADFHPATAAFRAKGGEFILHTYLRRNGRGAVFRPQTGERSNRIQTPASYPRRWRRPEERQRVARAPSMLPGRNGRFSPERCGFSCQRERAREGARGCRRTVPPHCRSGFSVPAADAVLHPSLPSAPESCAAGISSRFCRSCSAANFQIAAGQERINGAAAPPRGQQHAVTVAL